MKNIHRPKISIVLLSTNSGSLSESLRSCLNQTYKNVEIILVADECPADIGTSDSPPVIHIKPPVDDQRLGTLLNLGFAKASGDYLSWLDNNTQLAPQAMDELMNFLIRNPQVGLVYSDYFNQKHNSNEKTLQIMPGYLDFASDKVQSPGFLYSKSIPKNIGPYNPKFEAAAAFEYCLRTSRKFSMRRHPYALATIIEPAPKWKDITPAYTFLLKALLRYKNKYWNYQDIEASLLSFFDWIRQLTSGGKGLLLELSKTTLKLYILSRRAGLYFNFFIPYVIIKRKVSVIFTPLLAPYQKSLQQAKGKMVESKLNPPQDGINVLCLIPDMVVGGSEKVVWDIVNGLKPQGYHFHLMGVASETNAWCSQFRQEFENVLLLPKNFSNYNPKLDEEYYFYLQILVAKLAVNVLLISNAPPIYRLLPRLKKEFPHIRIIDMVHVQEFGGSCESALAVVPLIDKRVCISAGLREHLLQQYQTVHLNGTHIKRIRVIHNGNDMEKYSPAKSQRGRFKEWYDIHPNTKLITYVGRFSAEKRPNLFVDIAREVIAKNPQADIKFVMAGHGPTLPVVEERIDHYGLEDKFLLPGMIDSYRVRDLLADSFLTLIVSAIEGLPLVMVESLAMGVPVICTDVGSVKEGLQHEFNGFVIDPQERLVENSTDIILKLLSSQDLYESICRNTRPSVVEKFSLTTMAKRYLEVFQEFN